MPNRAKSYIACTAAAGLIILATGLYQAAFPNPARFLVVLFLALFASTLKVRLPGVTGTTSVNFLFILMGVAEFTFSETVALACTAALVQSIWRPKRRPQPVQVIFNVTSLAISVGAAYWGSHAVMALAGASSLPVMLALAACLFFVTNAGLVAVVISLAEEKPLNEVWRQCYGWSFPYYLVGAGIAGLVSVLARSTGWKVSLLVLPVMYLTYLWYRQYLKHRELNSLQQEIENSQELMAVSSEEF